MTIEWNAQTIAVGAAVGVGLYLFAKNEIGEALSAVDPTSRDNVVYRGANKVGAAVTQDRSFSLGTWLWETFNPRQAARDNEIASGATTHPAPDERGWRYAGKAGNPEAGTGPTDEELREGGTSTSMWGMGGGA